MSYRVWFIDFWHVESISKCIFHRLIMWKIFSRNGFDKMIPSYNFLLEKKKEDFLLARILIHIHILILVKMKRDLIFPWDVCIIGILSLIVEKLPITHLCLKFAYIVLLFVDDKGGEIYELMLWVPYLNLNYVKKLTSKYMVNWW